MRSFVTHLRLRLRLPSGEDRVAPLDGLRGIAVLLVFLVHVYACIGRFLLTGGLLAAGHQVELLGYTGVDVFFALSGYLIYGGLIRRPTGYLTYLGRRARRIYPNFLFVLAFYVSVCIVKPSLRRWPEDQFQAAIYFLQNLLLMPGVFRIQPIITVAWTLSLEFLFYLVTPVVIAVLRMRGWNPACRAALLVAGVPLFGWFASTNAPNLYQMTMFGAGMLAFELSQIPSLRPVQSRSGEIGLLLLTAFTITGILLGFEYKGIWANEQLFGKVQSNLVWIVLAGVIWFSLRPSGLIKKALCWEPLRFMGLISYSYYLIHGAVLNAFKLVVLRGPFQSHPELVAAVAIPVALVATIMVASVLFALIEYPFCIAKSESSPKPVQSVFALEGSSIQESEEPVYPSVRL